MKRLTAGLILFSLVFQAPAQELDRGAMEKLLSMAENTHTEALLIWRDGKTIVEKYLHNGSQKRKTEAMSATKSIVSLAVACMLSDHLLDSLDTPVSKYYPEWRQGRKRQITVRHLLNHTSGLQNVPNAGIEIYPAPDMVQLALAAELSDKPGAKFEYNNKALNLIAGVIKKATKERMDIYIGKRLFKPLGITDFTWTLDSSGNSHAMSGCQIRPNDLLKLGILVLQNGSWNANQVIAPRWIKEMVTPTERHMAYGLLWWLIPERTVSTVLDSTIDAYHKHGIRKDFILKARQMVGSYDNDEEFEKKLVKVFGENAWTVLQENLVPKGLGIRTRTFGTIIGYKAEGFLGNYLIVYPKQNLVAVRMTSYASYKDKKDSFGGFESMVLRLTQRHIEK